MARDNEMAPGASVDRSPTIPLASNPGAGPALFLGNNFLLEKFA